MSEQQINDMRASVQELIQLSQVAEESGAKTIVKDVVRQDSGYRGPTLTAGPEAADINDNKSQVSLRDLVDRRGR